MGGGRACITVCQTQLKGLWRMELRSVGFAGEIKPEDGGWWFARSQVEPAGMSGNKEALTRKTTLQQADRQALFC